MKINIVFIFLFSFINAKSQNNIKLDSSIWHSKDIKINIYFNRYCENGIVETNRISSDDVRNHPAVKICINNKDIINKFIDRLIYFEKKGKKTSLKSSCTVVIDIMHNDEIYRSIIIDRLGQFYLIANDNPNYDILYQKDDEFSCYLNDLFPYFITSIPGCLCNENVSYKWWDTLEENKLENEYQLKKTRKRR